MKKALLLIIASLLLCSFFVPLPAAAAAAENAEFSWKAEFDAVCGQSDNAMAMSVEELNKALARCDALQPQIEALEATPRKVYLKRLKMCRNLFIYLLESKGQAKK